MDHTETDAVLHAIGSVLDDDWEVSGDAMRCRPVEDDEEPPTAPNVWERAEWALRAPEPPERALPPGWRDVGYMVDDDEGYMVVRDTRPIATGGPHLHFGAPLVDEAADLPDRGPRRFWPPEPERLAVADWPPLSADMVRLIADATGVDVDTVARLSEHLSRPVVSIQVAGVTLRGDGSMEFRAAARAGVSLSVGPFRAAGLTADDGYAAAARRRLATALDTTPPPEPDPNSGETPRERALRMRQTRNTGPARNPHRRHGRG